MCSVSSPPGVSVAGRRVAFTLIEVLIVVAILAVIAGVIIPQYFNVTDDARASSTLLNLRTLRGQLTVYRSQHNDLLPDENLSELTSHTNALGEVGATPEHSLGPYLLTLPINHFTQSSSVKVISAAPTPADVNDSDGWLYNPSTGEVWINHADYLAQ